MSPRRIAFWMLATAGVAVGHIAGYGLAHPSGAAREAALGGHDYLPGVSSVVIPLGVLVGLAWAIRTARDLGMAGQIQWRHLAAAQVVVFVGQEVAERLAIGSGGLAAVVGERGVWFGLLAQVVVAWAVVRAIDVVRRIVRTITTPGARVLPLDVRPTRRMAVDIVVDRSRPVAVGARGPPVVGSFC